MTIGTLIKKIAIVLLVIGIIASVIMIIVGASAHSENADYMEYATVNGGAYSSSLENAGNAAYAGQQLWVLGLILLPCLALSSLLMVGFGQLIDDAAYARAYAEQNARKLEKLENATPGMAGCSPKPNSGPVGWTCKACGTKNPSINTKCTNCGDSSH